MINKKIAIYARVSTEGQAEEGFSIDAQIAKVREVNEILGHTVIEEYIDRGISGKSIENRPALLKMMEDARKGLFEEVVVYKLNRLARNHYDLLKIYEVLEENQVTFRSITEPFDTSNPAGKLLFNLLSSIGEFERETIVENVKNGMKQRAKQGLFNGGVMLGYRSKVFDDSREKSRLVIVPEEAEIVKFIFKLYTEGKGYKYISNRLNDLGYKSLRNNNFTIQAVKNIILNPTYVGMIRYNRHVNHAKKRREGNKNEYILVEGNHDAIIDLETWEKAQEILSQKSIKLNKSFKGVFILTGILKCPQCGASMVAGRVSRKGKDGSIKKWTYYQCNRYKNYGRNECTSNSINADYAEEYVLKYLSKFAFSDELIESVVGGMNRQVDELVIPLENRIKNIIKEKHELEIKKNKILNLYEEEFINKETLKDRLHKIETEYKDMNDVQKKLNEQLKEYTATTKIPVERVKTILKNLGNVISVSTREQIKFLLNLVIVKISVNEEKKIDKIEFKFDAVTQRKLLNKEDSSTKESSIFMPFSLII